MNEIVAQANDDPAINNPATSNKALSWLKAINWNKVLSWVGWVPRDNHYDEIEKHVRRLMLPRNSFLKYVPVYDYDIKNHIYRCYDSNKVGFVFEINPRDVEGLPSEEQESVRILIQRALEKPRSAELNYPWIMQTFTQDEPYNPEVVIADMKAYADENNAYTSLTENFLRVFKRFLIKAGKRGGYFNDPRTNSRWGVTRTVTRVLLYRNFNYQKWPDRDGRLPEFFAKETALNIKGTLEDAGVGVRFVTGAALRRWLVPFFNPHISHAEVAEQNTRINFNDDQRLSRDLGADLFYATPKLNENDNTGAFSIGGVYYRLIPIDNLLEKPNVGHFTIDHRKGDSIFQVFKSLPENSILCTNVVLEQKNDILSLIDSRFASMSMLTPDRSSYSEELSQIKAAVTDNHRMASVSVGVIIRADDKELLNRYTREVVSLLSKADFRPIDPREEDDPEYNLTRFVNHLPFSYRFENEREIDISRLWWMEDVAAMLPFYGRSTGSGHPGITLTNRDGSLIQFCPFKDRKKNSLLNMVGPTGAGKSSTACYMLTQIMAMVRPHLYLVDYGGSYEYAIEHFIEHGLKVKVYKMDIDNEEVAFPPFVDATVMVTGPSHPRYHHDRDYLNEMSFIAKIIATGGERKEVDNFFRQHRTIIEDGITLAGYRTIDDGRDQTMIDDVISALRELSETKGEIDHLERTYKDFERKYAAEIANNMEPFVRSATGRPFNREIKDIHDHTDYDVVLYEAGYLGQNDSNREWLLVFFMSCFIRFMNELPKRRLSGRRTMFAIDEAHKYVKDPVIIPFMDDATRTIRKIGGIIWLFTQTLRDYDRGGKLSDEIGEAAKSMLQQFEWWVTMSLEDEITEAEYIQKYNELTDAEVARLKSATKQPGYYVEAGIKSSTVNCLAQVVQPGEYMAMAYTEPDERKQIKEIAEEHNISEYEATKIMGQRLEEERDELFGRSFDEFGEVVT